MRTLKHHTNFLLLANSFDSILRFGFQFHPCRVISITPASEMTNITGRFSFDIISTAVATVPARSLISPVRLTHRLFSFQTDFALL